MEAGMETVCGPGSPVTRAYEASQGTADMLQSGGSDGTGGGQQKRCKWERGHHVS